MADIRWLPNPYREGFSASDDDEGWEMHATQGGFEIEWGSLCVSCDASDIEQAKEEAAHVLKAMRVWNREASERDRRRRHG